MHGYIPRIIEGGLSKCFSNHEEAQTAQLQAMFHQQQATFGASQAWLVDELAGAIDGCRAAVDGVLEQATEIAREVAAARGRGSCAAPQPLPEAPPEGRAAGGPSPAQSASLPVHPSPGPSPAQTASLPVDRVGAGRAPPSLPEASADGEHSESLGRAGGMVRGMHDTARRLHRARSDLLLKMSPRHRPRRLEHYGARGGPHAVLGSPAFHGAMVAVVLLHLGYMIYEADRFSSTLQPPPSALHGMVETAFWLVYTAELALYLRADGCGYFQGPLGRLHMLDALLVVLGLADVLLGLGGHRMPGNMPVNIFRMVRLHRLVRRHRLFVFSGKMSRLFSSVAACCSSFAGPAVLVTSYFVVSSLIIVPAVAEHVMNSEGKLTNEEAGYYKDNFGSVSRCMFRLYQSVTPGQDWVRMYDLLESISFWRLGTLYAFFHFVYLALIANVVLCSLLEKMLLFSMGEFQCVKHDQDQRDRADLEQILCVCKGQCGPEDAITYEEFLQLMRNSAAVRRCFDERGMTIADAQGVFRELDDRPPEERLRRGREEDFRADRVHFFDACMRLKREVRVIDFITSHARVLRCLRENQDTCDLIMSKLDGVEAQVMAARRAAAAMMIS